MIIPSLPKPHGNKLTIIKLTVTKGRFTLWTMKSDHVWCFKSSDRLLNLSQDHSGLH